MSDENVKTTAPELPPVEAPAAPELPPPPDPVEEGKAALKKFEALLARPDFKRLVEGLQHMRTVLGPEADAVHVVELAVAAAFERG